MSHAFRLSLSSSSVTTAVAHKRKWLLFLSMLFDDPEEELTLPLPVMGSMCCGIVPLSLTQGAESPWASWHHTPCLLQHRYGYTPKCLFPGWYSPPPARIYSGHPVQQGSVAYWPESLGTPPSPGQRDLRAKSVVRDGVPSLSTGSQSMALSVVGMSHH